VLQSRFECLFSMTLLSGSDAEEGEGTDTEADEAAEAAEARPWKVLAAIECFRLLNGEGKFPGSVPAGVGLVDIRPSREHRREAIKARPDRHRPPRERHALRPFGPSLKLYPTMWRVVSAWSIACHVVNMHFDHSFS